MPEQVLPDGSSSLLVLTEEGAALVAEADATFRDALDAVVRPVLTAELAPRTLLGVW